VLDGVGLAAPSESGYVDEPDGAVEGEVKEAVEGDDLIAGGASGGVAGAGLDGGENPVELVLHVAREVFGSRN